MKLPNEYFRHEALDRTSLILDLVESALTRHPGLLPEERKIALKIHHALFELYQAIGKEHL